MTDQEKIEAELEKLYGCEPDAYEDMDDSNMQMQAFKAGVTWARKNPSHEVLALAEALSKSIVEWEAVTPGYKSLVAWQIGMKALANFEKAIRPQE